MKAPAPDDTAPCHMNIDSPDEVPQSGGLPGRPAAKTRPAAAVAPGRQGHRHAVAAWPRRRPAQSPFESFSAVQYHLFGDDLGPMDLSSIIRFVEQLARELAACAKAFCRSLVFSVAMGGRSSSTAAVLLGGYMALVTPDS
jgi:hypothetical protein